MNDRDAPELIGIGSTPSRERADAARNRDRLLATAGRLFAERGVDGVSLETIAAEAGVGKGTLFRRFGSKAGLAAALIDAEERAFQERFMFGLPPLGPGAPASVRIAAFFDGYLDLLDDALALIRLSETAAPGARYRVGSYHLWQYHLSMLLAEACPGLDAPVTAHLLLASLSADLHHALREQQFASQRLRTALLTLVQRVTGDAADTTAR